MPVSSTPGRRAWFLSRCPVALLVLLLAAGCRGTQSAYQFRPAARPLAQHAVRADSGTVAKPGYAAAPFVAAAVAPGPGAHRPVRPVLGPNRLLRQPLRRAVARAAAQQPNLASARTIAMQRVHRVASPGETAEVGLGTTVLGVLGLVVLPISLIGLLIWGGPVWAVLAGLAALAVLVAYLDPFG